MEEGIEVDDREEFGWEERKRNDDDLHISTDGKLDYLNVAAFCDHRSYGDKSESWTSKISTTGVLVHLHLQPNVG